MTISTPQLVSASARVEEIFSAQAEDTIQSDSGTGGGTFAVTALLGTVTWNGTTTVAMTNTSQVTAGSYIRLDADTQFFRVISVTTNVEVQITNPEGLTIPSGATGSSVTDPTVVTLSAGTFADVITNTMRFRVTSGPLSGIDIAIDTRDSDTQITLQHGFPLSFTGADWVIVQADVFVFFSKNHKGSPNRELELISVRQAQEAASGPFFFNIEPSRVELLQQTFDEVSVFQVQGRQIRLYWNRGVGTNTDDILTINYDVFRNAAVTAVATLPFTGRDPFIMDARTGSNPNRLYLVYVNAAGRNAFRQSFDLGVTWVDVDGASGETLIDDVADITHTACEANFNDPQGDKEDVQVLQRRDA